LSVEPEWVQLNPEADFWLDVMVLEQAFAGVQGVPGNALDEQGAQALQRAVALYRGDLLEGWYQDWCLYERERLQHMYLAMLDKLMGYCEARRQYEAGLAYGTQMLRYVRARERTHRRLMRLHYLNQDRTAALRQFERCVAALREELDVEPAQRTIALCQQIRSDRPGRGSQRPPASGTALESAAPRVLGYLQRLHGVLAEVQGQVEQEIETVEGVLHR
jgi:DNA-binding SARP family transcriptional activator